MKYVIYGIVLSLIITQTTIFVTGRIVPVSLDIDKKSDNERELHTGDRHLKKQLPNYKVIREAEDTSEFWLNAAKEFVEYQLKKTPNIKKAKNLILFLGDGMSLTTIAGTRVYIGGEEKSLYFEKFPFTGLSKTYNVNTQVSDSASTATSYLNGVKTNYGVIGLCGRVPRYDCYGQLDPANHTHSIAKWAIDAGKSAGFVTTTRVTDASPAGVYAHIANRYWENNDEFAQYGCDSNILDDIAKQLIHGEVGQQLNVIMGGGRDQFRNVTMTDEEGAENKRTDGRDLIQEWLDEKDGSRKSYVWNATELLSVNASNTDYLLGLFEGQHCRYHLEVVDEQIEHMEPTLAQMTEKAIEVLSKNENGFFLFIEGGKIDKAHHETFARIAIDETAEFARAIEVAHRMLGDEDTLILATADHSHTLSYSGYAVRGSDIFGVSETYDIVYDHTPYLTLNYFDGPGVDSHMNLTTGKRVDPTTLNMKDIRFSFPSSVKKNSVSHSGEDVAVYAIGPWSHLFTGVLEDNTIPYIMSYASCIGDGPTMCDDDDDNYDEDFE